MTEAMTDPAPAARDAGAGRDVPAELAERLRIALQRLVPALRVTDIHRDLTPSRLSALVALDAHGPVRIGELAARMGIALSTTSRMTDLLEGLGWIARRTDPDDQRASLVDLNGEGRELLTAVRGEGTARLAAEIGGLSGTEQVALRDALPALERLAGRAARQGAPRPDRSADRSADRRARTRA
jgi:DNA-binding MarR family transcriptional regulator